VTVTQPPSPSQEPLALRVRAHGGAHFSTGERRSLVAEVLLSRSASGRVLPLASRGRKLIPGALEAEGFTGDEIAA
jgi:hypothetical protein